MGVYNPANAREAQLGSGSLLDGTRQVVEIKKVNYTSPRL